jgi:hypothetical protein
MSSRQAERVSKLRREKRGVVLLVVVSILTLFLMVGVTYVLIAGHYHDSSKQNQRAKRYGDEPEREMEEVIGQVLFGTPRGANGPRSVLGPHNLLEDLYGTQDAVAGQITFVNPAPFDAPPLYPLNGGQCTILRITGTANIIPNYFAGRVITFTNGRAAGISTRVMAYFPAGAPYPDPMNPGNTLSSGVPELMIESPESDLPIGVMPSNGDNFIMNGAPFNGTGAGFVNRTAGPDGILGNGDDVNVQNLEEVVTLDYTGPAHPYGMAYLPNYQGYPVRHYYPNYSNAPMTQGVLTPNPALGGLDESWDIADYQNMFLGMVPPLKMAQFDALYPLLPSYHRPDLVRFWIRSLQQSGGLLNGVNDPTGNLQREYFVYPYGRDGIRDGTIGDNTSDIPDRMQFTLQQADELVALKRMMIFRPLHEDHPNFTGGNSNFAEDNLQGPYDIDNDGDGITDSIWVDPGLPVVTAPNGRRYKRLVAILIKDLDGRVNPNVHGNLAQVDSFFQPNANPNRAATWISSVLQNYPPTIPAAPQGNQVTLAGVDFNNANAGNFYLPRGQGFGPAEVDFRHILGDDPTVYENVLLQRYFTTSSQESRPGFSDPLNQNNPLNDDGWSRLRTIGMPADHTTQLSMYSTPPDVWGRGAMAVDYTGQPLWTLAGIGERLDDPYEIQWNQLRASADAPYTVSELEALLRYHDLGATTLASRLMQTAGGYLAMESRGTPGPSQVRREAFGIGTYIPTPKMTVPRELRAGLGAGVASSPTILDIYFGSVSQNIANFRTIVPFEFLKGQMFNLNRELGNGLDDDGNGVVDDPGEYGGETISTSAGQLPLDYLNDTPAFNTPNQRHLYARHLYCLMMLLRNRPPNAQDTIDLDGNGTGSPNETARYYAQWAINVVDFRDPDSIMTPFEYDVNPFNGWSVDGTIGTVAVPSPDDTDPQRGLVWGCERPELLITETINLHDSKTEDEADDVDSAGNANNGQVADPENDPVNDFDQRLSPEGSTFIELYNPWFDRSNSSYDHKAAELFANGGVNLAKLHNGTTGSPVWRMIVVNATPGGMPPIDNNLDPDFPQPESLLESTNANPPPAGEARIDRSIYFADLSAMGVVRPSGDGEAFFPSSAIPRAPILPGRYAVIGSAGHADPMAGTYTTAISRRVTDPNAVPARPDYSNTRRIVLTPSANPNAAQTVRILDNLTDGMDDVVAADHQPVVALPINRVIRGGVARPHSLNVSEPFGGYAGQPGGPALPPAQAPLCQWVPPTALNEGYYSSPIDTPLDIGRTDGGQVFAGNVTAINYRAIHLQRLANPLLPWNSATNPYLTVDTSSMDVMSFNGVTNGADPSIPPSPAVSQNFQAFQRGGRYYNSDPEIPMGQQAGYAAPLPPTLPQLPRVERALWPAETTSPSKPSFNPFQLPSANSPTEATANAHFQTRPLYHTLGYINRRYHPYFGAAAPQYYRGAPYFQDANGNSLAPFAYLAFNNRPFNNIMELLQVPCWPSSQLLRRFDGQYIDPNPMNPPTSWTSMYQPPVLPVPPNQAPLYAPHLLNFFPTSTNPNANSTAPEISRLLDYVETRTPYLDTEKNYNPVNFVSGNQAPAGYRPPFNYLSRFREPGRININTILDSNVWDAAVRGFPGMCGQLPEGDSGTFLLHLVLSRQGYGTNAASMLQHNDTFPSLFSHPFRTADSADMMPPLPAQLRRSPAEGGLTRRDLNPYPSINDTDRPLFASDSTLPYQDAARNPYFRYQGLQKVGNLFSTNSNCYAVWITMGYFEVEANDADNDPSTPATIDAAHPDGLRLAQEVGVDSGEVKRHRAFYIIDRSIPVGYEPGHRHNTDKAILLKRFIE